MVHSVAAVPMTGRVRRDPQRSCYPESGSQSSKGSFAQVLENVTKEVRDDSIDCRTTTYGRDSRIETFYYQSRAYHF